MRMLVIYSTLQRTNSKKYAPEDKLIFQPQFNELFDIWEEYMETQKSIAQQNSQFNETLTNESALIKEHIETVQNELNQDSVQLSDLEYKVNRTIY